MRAPQYGGNKVKKRGAQSALPPKPKRSHAVGLRWSNDPLPMHRIRYLPPRQVQYDDGTYGAAVTLHLHHKSADWVDGIKVGGEGPIVSKRYAVVKKSQQ
jgi:hypothetical protein